MQKKGGNIMPRQLGWKDDTPLDQKAFLTLKEAAKHTGIGYDLTKQLVKGGEFKDYITVGKQNKLLVDRVAYVDFIKQKGYVEMEE